MFHTRAKREDAAASSSTNEGFNNNFEPTEFMQYGG
jgi:hypothetical protein